MVKSQPHVANKSRTTLVELVCCYLGLVLVLNCKLYAEFEYKLVSMQSLSASLLVCKF